MSDFVIQTGNTLPVLTDTLTYSDGTAANLTGASVRFQMKSPQASVLTTNAVATITSPSAGGVSYTFTTADTATAGYYIGQWQVTFPGGQTQNWPTLGYITILVAPSVSPTTTFFNTPGTPALTVGFLIDRTFDLLLGAAREERNQLAASLDSTTTTFNVNYALGSLNRGTYLCIDDETMYVWATVPGSTGSSSVTVRRGDRGTTAVAHSAGAIIQVNPYFPRYTVRKTLQDEIRSWAPQVFQAKTVDIAATNFVRGYDLGALGDWFYILRVSESPDTLTGLTGDNLWRDVECRIEQSSNLAAFPSGNALFITSPLGVFDTPRTIHVTYAAPIDVDSTFDDNDYLYLMGVDNSDVDIAPYGAAWRLAASREVRRTLTEAQGQNSDLQNFPPGYMIKAASDFKEFRDSRLRDAELRLRGKYPIRRTV